MDVGFLHIGLFKFPDTYFTRETPTEHTRWNAVKIQERTPVYSPNLLKIWVYTIPNSSETKFPLRWKDFFRRPCLPITMGNASLRKSSAAKISQSVSMISLQTQLHLTASHKSIHFRSSSAHYICANRTFYDSPRRSLMKLLITSNPSWNFGPWRHSLSPAEHFFHGVRSNIFSIIRFSSGASRHRERIQDFNAILHSCCILPDMCMKIELTIASFDNDWVAGEREFIDTMELIRRSGSYIRKLSIRGSSFPEKFSDARSLEKNFLKPFIFPFITSLKISRMMSIPISLLASSVNLKDLFISYSDLEPFGDHLDMSLLQSCPKIQNIEFDPPLGVIDTIIRAGSNPDISPIADLSCLRTLRTFTNLRNVEAVQKIVQIAADSLEEVYLSDDENYCKYI